MEHRGTDDLNGFSSSTVASSHLHVHLRNSAGKARVSKLLVHVHSVRARVVPQDDSVVLDVAGSLLEDLPSVKNSWRLTSLVDTISP